MIKAGLVAAAIVSAQPGDDLGGLGYMAMLMSGGLSADEGPFATATLAPGEVLLELSVSAIEQAPISEARYSLGVFGSGATTAAAEADRDRKLAALLAAARANGAGEADIEVERREQMAPMIAVPPPPPPSPGASPPRGEERTAETVSTGTDVEIVIRGAARIAAFRQALAELDVGQAGRPATQAADTDAARRTARARALASARADAEAQAREMNMRVVRMVRVSERSGPDLLSLMMSGMGGGDLFGIERAMRGDSTDSVPVPVFLGVDFILGPR